MLSPGALRYLKPLRYDPGAARISCMIPMGGIYWTDEIPDFHALRALPEADRELIYRLFSIRFKIWAGHELDSDDQRFWDTARSQVPDYPVFHRTDLTPDDRAAQEAAEEDTVAALQALFGGADEVTVGEDGSISGTYDLTKDQPKP